MNNIMRVVQLGVCTGCNACSFCEHISFVKNQYSFYVPVVDEKCNDCGKCLEECVFDPYKEDGE